MSNIPADLKYTDEHEWIRQEGDLTTIGITDFAQDQLTDVVFVELPEVGRQVKVGDPVAVLESVKSVADVLAPLDGEVVEVNGELEDHPERVNDDAYGEGWIYKIKASGELPDTVLDAAGYEKFLAEQ